MHVEMTCMCHLVRVHQADIVLQLFNNVVMLRRRL